MELQGPGSQICPSRKWMFAPWKWQWVRKLL